MKKNTSGYDSGKAMWDSMCADGGKTQVKGYARGGKVKPPSPRKYPTAPPVPKPTSKDTPKVVVTTKAKGGAIKIDPANKGKLHKSLGVAADKKIPMAKLEKAADSSNETTRKRAQFAINAKSFKHKATGGAVHSAKQDKKIIKAMKGKC